MPIIHLYPNQSFHEPAYIVGNEEGLRALRAIIDVALVKRKASSEVFCNDGEGYDLHVIIAKDTGILAVPYTEEFAKERRENVKWPWEKI